jgi:AcrR family transcriptional regulator
MRALSKSPVPGPFISAAAPAPVLDAPVAHTTMRTVPRQQRARDAVQRILKATGELLDDAGFEALTTTAVAERAGVNIATLYRYFPDKFSIVQALAVAIEAARAERIARLLQQFAATDDWRPVLRAIVVALIDVRLQKTGARGLRRALHSAPQLWEVERGRRDRLAAQLAWAMRQRLPSMTPRRADAVARTVLLIIVGVLDWVVSDPKQRHAAMREGSLALEHYLADYLD